MMTIHEFLFETHGAALWLSRTRGHAGRITGIRRVGHDGTVEYFCSLHCPSLETRAVLIRGLVELVTIITINVEGETHFRNVTSADGGKKVSMLLRLTIQLTTEVESFRTVIQHQRLVGCPAKY